VAFRRRKQNEAPPADPSSAGVSVLDANPDAPEPPVTRAAAAKRRPTGVVTLKAVGIGRDGRSILLARSGSKKGSFRLAIDEGLVEQLEAAATARRPPPEPEPAPVEEAPKQPASLIRRPTSKLTIAEIQHFLRQGKDSGWIAKKAGVPIEWVERFEGPVVWERVGMARRARKATMTRSRKGPSKLELEYAVRSNLKARGLPVPAEGSDDGWDSVRRPKKKMWIVTYTFKSRGQTRNAQWEFDPEAGKIVALNDLGAELGWARK
jgi:hypothetical protein